MGVLLSEGLARRGHHDEFRGGGGDGFDCLVERIGKHDHPGASAVGAVVGRVSGVFGEISWIHQTESHRSHFGRSLQHACFEESPQHFWEDCDDIDL